MAKRKAEVTSQSITWESVRRELNSTRTDQGQVDYDGVRRAKLAALEAYTKRPAVLYATDFLNEDKTKIAQNAMSITPDDVRGLAEVVRGIPGDAVDLILHSPGGSPEAAESIVAVLRSQFKHVRALVPLMAKSAATITVEHTFRGAPVLKMWENSRGVGLFQVMQAQLIVSAQPRQQMGGG